MLAGEEENAMAHKAGLPCESSHIDNLQSHFTRWR